MAQMEETKTATRTVDGREVPVAGKWSLDPTHTSITFEARHMMIAKVRGAFDIVEGWIEVGEDPKNSVVDVTVDLKSVDTGTADRDAHLRSADFFDVDNHPTARFRSTSVEVADGGYRLTGDLTIRGVTKPVTLEFDFTGGLVDPYGKPRIAFSATTEVDRTDWDLTWNMPLDTGGVMVGNKIKLFIDTEAVLSE